MTIHSIITHGSEDSLDHDVYVVFDEIPSFQEAKEYCHSLSEYNANIIVVTDGTVSWSFKGTEDECNNSIMQTYHLHQQEFENPIKTEVSPNLELKIVRTIRGLLSYFSRTELRPVIKHALRSDDLSVKIDALRQCKISYDLVFVKTSHVELMKFYAFQLAQTIALIKYGVFIFTKSSAASYFPTLKPYLYREENVDVANLQLFFDDFIDFIESHVFLAPSLIGKTGVKKYIYFHKSSSLNVFDFIEHTKFKTK